MVALTHNWCPEKDKRNIRDEARLDQLMALLIPTQEQHDEEPATYCRDRLRDWQFPNRQRT